MAQRLQLPFVALLGLSLGVPGLPAQEAAPNEPLNGPLRRLAEEAEVFGSLSQRIIGEETLEQVTRTIPRYQPRKEPPPPKVQRRKIQSEYGFTLFKNDPNLHEIRNVQTVDGKRVKPPGRLRETLAMGSRGNAERWKRNLLKEFQGYGLREAALEFGQMILMFGPRMIRYYQFQVVREEFLGADRVAVLRYAQTAGVTSMTVFADDEVVRYAPTGELWLRASDGMPLRITMDISRVENGATHRHFGSVDYQMTSYGCVMPVTAAYSESVTLPGKEPFVFVDNRFQYTNFKMFGASSEVKFTAEDEPVTPPPTKKQ